MSDQSYDRVRQQIKSLGLKHRGGGAYYKDDEYYGRVTKQRGQYIFKKAGKMQKGKEFVPGSKPYDKKDVDKINKVFNDIFNEEKVGLVPSTEWKKNALGRGWVLGETLITGIGQGYIQTTPIQLCLMTAQIGNGGYKIYPKIVVDDKKKIQPEDKYMPLYDNS